MTSAEQLSGTQATPQAADERSTKLARAQSAGSEVPCQWAPQSFGPPLPNGPPPTQGGDWSFGPAVPKPGPAGAGAAAESAGEARGLSCDGWRSPEEPLRGRLGGRAATR